VCISAQDVSPTASPKVITPAVDAGVPQYPTAYNGDTAADIQMTPSATESPTPYTPEPALPATQSESDTSTAKEQVGCGLYCSLSLVAELFQLPLFVSGTV